ncbi:exonuclease mut-7 homolog isoform X2 [Pecten maximus]|uniref:exonuclease mut-7 homolog isoform X2 n=1 Tax=Pecten maximus TaxID=6579 RepID=UPI001457FD04|nr:exonuclease mut-7 homolog isoform X2 [Pecten maximus]
MFKSQCLKYALPVEENEPVKILQASVKKGKTKSNRSSLAAKKRGISKHSMAQPDELNLVPGGAEGNLEECDNFYAAHFPPLQKEELDRKTKSGSSTKATSFKQISVTNTSKWMAANMDKTQRETTVGEMKKILEELEDKWGDDTKKDKTNVYRTLRHHLSKCTNPYTLVAYIVEKSKDYHLPKTSTLAYCIMKEFDNWCSSKENIHKYSQFLLTQDLKLHVLHMCTRYHMTMIGLAIKAFQLDHPENSFLVPVLRCFLEKHKFKEAAVCAGKLGLQDHFSVEEIVLPLILQDKVNLIETFLMGNPGQQLLVVQMLDRLCDRSVDMAAIIGSSGVQNVKREKMHWKPLSKLAARLMKLYDISPDLCPNISNARGLGAVKYLLYKRYIEGSMGAGSWEEMVQSAVGDSAFLKEQLIEQLMCYNETTAAAKWADHYELSDECIPPVVAEHRKSLKENPGLTTENIDGEDWDADCYTDGDIKTSWYPLKISQDAITMVNTKESYSACLQRLSRPGTTIGIDSEWKPGFGNTVQRLALMQLAVLDHIYLLDIIYLSQHLQEDDWQQFVACVFCNPAILKLGYGLDSDFQMFVKMFPFLKENLSHMCRVVELEKVAQKVIDKTVNLLPETGQSDEEDAPLEDCDSGVNIKFPKKEARGLSELVRQTLGRPLSKTEQMSNWERRPLRPAQITYAALDAHVLLEVYDELIRQAQKLKMNFDMEPPVSMKWMKASKRDKMKAKAKGQKFPYKNKSPKTTQYTSPHPRGAGPSHHMSPGQLKVVVDSMLQGLGRQLRSCGVDVYILENHEDHDRTIEICRMQNRIVLTSGNPYIMVRSHVGEHMCYCVQSVTAREQVIEVMEHFGVKVKTEDIFSRCQVCNGDQYLKIPQKQTRQLWFRKQQQSSVTGSRVQMLMNIANPSSMSEADMLCMKDLASYGVNWTNVSVATNGAPIHIETVPEGILEKVDLFYVCQKCGKVFWEGSHFTKVKEQFAHVLTLGE